MTVCLVLLLVSCSDSDVPDGYQLIACEGDLFRLYVPLQSWMPNTTSGITSAYYSISENSSVSVNIADDAGEMSVAEYWEYCNENFTAELDGYKFIGKENAVLGGQAAQKNIYTANAFIGSESVSYKYMMILSRFEGNMYIFLYSAPEDSYDSHIGDVEGTENDDGVLEGIIPYFRFTDEPYYPDEDMEYSNKVTPPEGMKLASTDERPYRFFVPEDWTIDKRTEISSAYYSEEDKSNVTLQGFMSDKDGIGVADYFADCEEGYKESFTDYQLVSTTDTRMGELNAKSYVFTATMGGVKYKVMQTICLKGAMFYTLTYTALEESFDAHLDDVQKMTENFEVR